MTERPAISTHILDTSRGRPAEGVPVQLYKQVAGEWNRLAGGLTNQDGRFMEFVQRAHFTAGIYKIRFETKSYFERIAVECFYPDVDVIFEVKDATQHYHVPLLLNPYGYSTYRGS